MNIEYDSSSDSDDPDYIPHGECVGEECDCFMDIEPLNGIIKNQDREISKLKKEIQTLRNIILGVASAISKEINS